MVAYKLSKNGWVLPFFVIFTLAREKLLVTVALDHPVAQTLHDFITVCHPTQTAVQHHNPSGSERQGAGENRHKAFEERCDGKVLRWRRVQEDEATQEPGGGEEKDEDDWEYRDCKRNIHKDIN